MGKLVLYRQSSAAAGEEQAENEAGDGGVRHLSTSTVGITLRRGRARHYAHAYT